MQRTFLDVPPRCKSIRYINQLAIDERQVHPRRLRIRCGSIAACIQPTAIVGHACGQGIGAINAVTSTAELVAKLRREYQAARARLKL